MPASSFALSGDSQLKPYTSWADFTTYLKNPASIINFMAAYGQHELILNATSLEGKRAAVNFLLFGDANNAPPADAMDFFNSTGAWATKETGLNMVDFWIGGLAERKMNLAACSAQPSTSSLKHKWKCFRTAIVSTI